MRNERFIESRSRVSSSEGARTISILELQVSQAGAGVSVFPSIIDIIYVRLISRKNQVVNTHGSRSILITSHNEDFTLTSACKSSYRQV